MKHALILIVFFFTISSFSQTADFSQIETTLYYYLDGDLTDDYNTIKKAFHENATMKSISSKTGDYREYNALEIFKKATKRETPKPNITSQIDDIHISGTAASAKLTTNSKKATVVDYMHLLKIEGTWKIVSKIYSVTLHKN